MAGWFAVASERCGAVICNVQMLANNKRALVEWLHNNSAKLVDVIIWDKSNGPPQMAPNVLSNAFEFLFVFGGKGSRTIPYAHFHGNIANIVRINPQGETNEFSEIHRATMPLPLPVWILHDLCPKAGTVFEPFGGTGTTLIAAEQLGRRCFALEISPAYCDVIVGRWEILTGKKAKRAKRSPH